MAGELRNAIKTVLWGMLGIRKRSDHDRETRSLNPVHVIAVGVVFVAIFVLVLFALARFLTTR